jgi:hypothetical protein
VNIYFLPVPCSLSLWERAGVRGNRKESGTVLPVHFIIE